MARLKVYGSVISTNTLRVVVCLFEKGLDFEFVPINLADGEQKKEYFLNNLNPFGQVPVFEDGDLKLFESRGITKYIVHEYANKGTELIERENKKMAVVGTWMEAEAHQFESPSTNLAWELAFKPMFGMTTDEAVVAAEDAKLSKVLDVYEKRLGQSKYLGGDTFTLADLHHAPNLHFLMGTIAKDLVKTRPCVSAWCDELLARPSWKKVVEWQKAHA
ncbi:glutathione S-transferase PARB-like [Aristolochia californica]|uniref:glutathione S-transferase PARB-like n=1 Tax=Aristolochia californica TaxID=171875 RepID=UPI0035DB7B69